MTLTTDPGTLRQAATALLALLALLGGARATSTADLVAQGNAAYAQGKLDEALAHYDEASVASPESPQLHFNRGTVHYKKENFAEAIDSFKQAALRSKDLDLAARAKYNLGNCAFRNGQRQRDSDLKKAIEHCQESISYYQEAHGMDSEFSEAAENIEIVRLYVKTLLDEQKKQQEQQEQQQQQENDLVKKLKELIKRQNALMSENEELRKARPAPTHPAAEPWQKALDALTGKEGSLRGDTGKVLVEMRQSIEQIRQQAAGGAPPAGGATAPGPAAHPDATGFAEKLEQASGHVGNAMADEQLAEDHLAAAKQESALVHQANAVTDLKEAVKVLSEEQQQQQDQQQQEGDQDQQESDQNQDEQEQDRAQDEQEEQGEENQQEQDQSQGEEGEEGEQEEQEAQARAERAEDILDEEKDNQKKRQPARPGRVRPVDKDW